MPNRTKKYFYKLHVPVCRGEYKSALTLMKNHLLHYEALSEFRTQFYKDLLTYEHVVGTQLRIDKVSFADGSQDDAFNFWGYRLDKDGIKYLLPCKDRSGNEIDLKSVLPIMVTATQKVAHRNEVYLLIKKYASARFTPKKTMEFREFVDNLSYFEHSKPEHLKLYWFITLAQVFGRANFRISSPASFGKDSVVDIMGNLVGNCATIVNPTRAKLEYRTMYKLLAVNEVASIQKAEWDLIEQFLLDAGAFKPRIEKQTRAFGAVGESLDIGQFSLSLLYNDVDHYHNIENYLDFKAHKALLNRFPPFRLHGVYREDFTTAKNENIPRFVKAHFEEYKDLLYNYTYYKQHIFDIRHGFSTARMRMNMPERWIANIKALLSIVDAYCETQEEFDKWIDVIEKSMDDYKEMLSYPAYFTKLKKRLSPADLRSAVESIKKADEYKDKNVILQGILENGIAKDYKDVKGLW